MLCAYLFYYTAVCATIVRRQQQRVLLYKSNKEYLRFSFISLYVQRKILLLIIISSKNYNLNLFLI